MYELKCPRPKQTVTRPIHPDKQTKSTQLPDGYLHLLAANPGRSKFFPTMVAMG